MPRSDPGTACSMACYQSANMTFVYKFILLRRNRVFHTLILSTWICYLIYLLGVLLGSVLVHGIWVACEPAHIWGTRASGKERKSKAIRPQASFISDISSISVSFVQWQNLIRCTHCTTFANGKCLAALCVSQFQQCPCPPPPPFRAKAQWGNSPGWGHISCLNAPGWGRRKRANAPPPGSSSFNTSAVFLLISE